MIFPNVRRLTRRVFLGFLAVVLFCAASGWAFRVKEKLSSLDDLVFSSPQLRVTQTPAEAMSSPVPLPNIRAIQAMLDALGPPWTAFVDLRTGRPTLIDGGAVPWIPGPANTLAWESFGSGCRENACIPVGTVEALARQFMARYPNVFLLDGLDLVLDPDGSGPVWDSLYFLRFQLYYKEVILRGASAYFRINNGNLIQVAVSYVGNVATDAVPTVNLDGAWDILYGHAGGRGEDVIVDKGTLEFIPVTPKGSDPEVLNGMVGGMLDYVLVWRVSFQRKGMMGTWEGLVDAHTGDLLAFRDANRYGHVHGGIRPSDGMPPEENRPFPYVDITTACAAPWSDGAGNFTGNNATSTLCGKYAQVQDACGAISNTTTTGDLDFLVDNAAGTDCVVPAGNPAGVGNTHSARTLFYNCTAINLKAQVYNPTNTWLQNNYVILHANGGALCNASSSGLNIYFYQHVPGECNNLGEIPGVAMHEWAHSYDSNDGSGAMDPPVETYADFTAIIQTHNSCMGSGFFLAENCSGYGNPCTTCTGIRDCDYVKHVQPYPWTYQNHTTGTPSPPTTIWGCGSGGYNGPCGWEDHCESGISTQALWDFVYRDLTDPCPGGPMCNNGFTPLDLTSAWMLEDRLWFTGVITLDAMYTCSAGVTNGCTGDVLYTVMRALDDDGDGTANGTPHAHAIYHALNRHLIDCNTYNDTSPQNQNQTSCPALNTPTLSGTAGTNQAILNWTTGGANATRYFVYRNESSCSVAFTRIATVNAPTLAYTDNGVVNGTTYYYRVQAAAASDSCVSPSSNCVTVTPQPCEALVTFDKAAYRCTDTVNVTVRDLTPGAGPWTVQAWSTTDATHKTITLVNNPPGSALYMGTFTTVPSGAGADQVNVADGATITVRFTDPDYCGTPNQDVVKTVPVDCAGPVISNVQVISITDTTATVTWTTNESANSRVTYGASVPPGTNRDDLTTYGTSHSIALAGLTRCTYYYVSVTSADPTGNITTDTNGGSYYQFKTLGRQYAFGPDNVETGPGSWTATGQWHRDTCRAHSGTYAWKAGSTTCPGFYDNLTNSDLKWGADITLGAAGHGYHLRYWDYYQTEAFLDWCRPQISTNGGATWIPLVPYTGQGTTWTQRDYDLATYTGSTVRIGFNFWPDGAVSYEGWYVDDIDVSRPQACGPSILYQSRGPFTQITGDGDANYERGEKWSVAVTLVNAGVAPATNVAAQLAVNGITVCNNPGSFGAMAVGATATYTFEFVIPPTFTPCGGAINFNIVGKTCTEEGSAGPDENSVFSIANVGHSMPGSPTELVIQPSVTDTYVNQNAATTNYGTATTMLTNVRTSREEDVLVQFDLSGIPAGATINSATLELYNTVAPASAYAVDVNRNTAAWTETVVTWNTKPAYDATNIAQITPTVAVGWKIWTVTSAVQGWYSGTYANYGFTVRPDVITGNTNILYTFATRENATTGNRPILRVNYTPAGSWECSYVGSGSCGGAGPKPVPDGRLGGVAQRGAKVTADGSNLTLTYDTASCTQADHSILYGLLTGLNPITPTGGVCSIGNTSPHTWNGSPAGNIWWVIVGDNGTTESSWGQQMSGGVYSQRSTAASNQCGNTAIDVTGTCP